jgi:hypothetical protein
MKIQLFIIFLFTGLFVSAQQISFKNNYPKGSNAYITTFTELKSTDFVMAYTQIKMNAVPNGLHMLELHLMKVDQNGGELWDKLIRKDTTSDTTSRFCTQSIAEQADGSLLLDITYPYGEKYIVKFDADGNQKWETYIHNSFGDYNIYSQLLKQRGKNLALADGSALSIGGSFKTINPRATLSVIDANGTIPVDHPFYRGYFNEAYFLNIYTIYTVGVEQTDSNESLVFSQISTDGNAMFHIKVRHAGSEKILATAMNYTYNKIRVAESVSKKDSLFSVNVYEYSYTGVLLNSAHYKMNCAASYIDLSYFETDIVLSNKCQSEQNQSIEKIDINNHIAFNFTDSFDGVLQLKKIHDGNYVFAFSKGNDICLWKFNSLGTTKTGTEAEGLFYPNPAKDIVTLMGSKETFNHGLDIRVYDMTGNTLIIHSFDRLEPVTLNLYGLREGIYGYNIITDDGITLRGKLIVYQRN